MQEKTDIFFNFFGVQQVFHFFSFSLFHFDIYIFRFSLFFPIFCEGEILILYIIYNIYNI